MDFPNRHQLIIFASMVILTNAQLLRVEEGLYSVNGVLSGYCLPTGADDEVKLTVSDSSYKCQSVAASTPLTDVGNVTRFDNKTQIFSIANPTLRVYNIFCNSNGDPDCKTAVIYNISVEETADGGLVCNLRFGNDREDQFTSPDGAEWLRDGELIPGTSKSLVNDDFSDEVSEGLKYIDFSLNKENNIPGSYECRFTQSNEKLQALSAEFTKFGKPVERSFKFNPSEEQYEDGDSVVMTCSFSGYPRPNITWYHNNELLEGTTVEIMDGLSMSSRNLTELDDKRDKGDYKCVANNSAGEATSMKRLRVRDSLAALWPFLGIVVQVILLAICIALGEKYRKKRLAKKRLVMERNAQATKTDT